MTHPTPSDLALFAGRDLGWLARWRAARHLSRCPECRDEVRGFTEARDRLITLNELPAISWNRLAIDMKANIRLGLEAGECVGAQPQPQGLLAGFHASSGVRNLAVCASLMALLAAGLLLERPVPTAPAAQTSDSALLRATANGIELREGGETLSLLHVRSDNAVYSAGAQGSMRAGYVDSDTGNVTINNLYVQ